MSVLTHGEIERLVQASGLIRNYSPHQLQGASYDMRLGPEYMREGARYNLDQRAPSLTLEPGDFVILSTLEYLNMPNDLVGHNGIMSPWAKRGVVSLFSPQIDLGFEGILVVPVFNAGDARITLSLGDPVFTVEFVRTDAPAAYGWSDRFDPQSRIPMGASPSAVRANLADVNDMQDQVETIADKLDQVVERQSQIERDFEYQKGLHSRKGANLRRAAFYLALGGAIAAAMNYAWDQGVVREFLIRLKPESWSAN